MSDDLIDQLAADLKPIQPGAARLRVIGGLVAGVALSAVLLVAWLGLRTDLAAAVATPIFWVKFAYPFLLAGAGLYAVDRLSRPGATAPGTMLFVTVLFALTVILGTLQFVNAEPEAVRGLIMGGSALVCPFYIVALSVPVFIATLLVMRTLAPTRMTLAGLAAGLLAGGVGAWVYSFHCGENGLPFLAIWYTAGIAAMAAIGAVSGRYLLRW
jgi:hypothetical protein